MSIVTDALLFATQKHLYQHRKGTRIPYMTHLLNVCKLLAERECSDTVLAGALLHDVLEDTEVTIEEVEQRFGAAVTHLVRGATELDKLFKQDHDKKERWRIRKQHTIDFVNSKATVDQLLVIVADKLDNICSIRDDVKRLGEVVWDRFNAPYMEQLWYFTTLSESMQQRTSESALLADLAHTFAATVKEVFREQRDPAIV